MTRDGRLGIDGLAVVVFGDGSIPEVLLDCMQFRIAADHAAAGRARPGHLLQLRGHVERRGCTQCRGYLIGRLAEREVTERRLA